MLVLSPTLRKYLVVRQLAKISLFPESPNPPPPPGSKVHRGHADPQVTEGSSTEVAVIRALHTGIRIISPGIRLNSIYREPHDLPKYLADFILGKLFITGELKNARE